MEIIKFGKYFIDSKLTQSVEVRGFFVDKDYGWKYLLKFSDGKKYWVQNFQITNDSVDRENVDLPMELLNTRLNDITLNYKTKSGEDKIILLPFNFEANVEGIYFYPKDGIFLKVHVKGFLNEEHIDKIVNFKK